VENILLTFLFVKGIKREITVATGRCRQLSRCYVQSMSSGHDDFNMPVATVNPVGMARF
jgi:hypothetical protein